MYDEGDVITDAICWQCDNTVVLSKKKMLIESSQSGSILNTFEELQVLCQLTVKVKLCNLAVLFSMTGFQIQPVQLMVGTTEWYFQLLVS